MAPRLAAGARSIGEVAGHEHHVEVRTGGIERAAVARVTTRAADRPRRVRARQPGNVAVAGDAAFRETEGDADTRRAVTPRQRSARQQRHEDAEGDEDAPATRRARIAGRVRQGTLAIGKASSAHTRVSDDPAFVRPGRSGERWGG